MIRSIFPLCILTALTMVIDTRGQAVLQPEQGEEAVIGSLVGEDTLAPKEKSRLNDLRYARRRVEDPIKAETLENRRVLAKAAKWYTYRLTHPIFHGSGKMTMNLLIKEAFRQLLLESAEFRNNALKPDQEFYLSELSKEMIPCIREILSKNSKPIVRINAVRMLTGIATAGPYPEQEIVADTLIDILGNPKENDGVKLYALRAMKELLAHGTPEKSRFKDPKREARTILALQTFLMTKPKLAPDVTPAEVAGYRYVRREAIRALANSRYPSLPGAKDLKGRTAWLLMRVLAKDGYEPPPDLYERLEAAIGVCKLIPSLDRDYQVDYAAEWVGKLVVDFAKAYTQQNLGAGQAYLPWKVSAARLVGVLDQFKTKAKNVASGKAAAYADTIATEARQLALAIAKGKGANTASLESSLRTSAPNTSVYSGVPDSGVKSPD